MVSLVLTNGDIDKIAEKIQEINMKTWDKIDDRCKAILVEVKKGIVEIKVLPQAVKQLE